MYRGASVAVVVPAYNEGPFIGEVLDGMPAIVDSVYAVDDCSTDDTWHEIESRTARVPVADAVADGGSTGRPRIVPVRHRTNRGRGAAVMSGYRRAYSDGMDVIAVMDGDGQMDPDRLERLLDPVVDGRADYAKGNRLASTTHLRGMSAWRLFGNVLLTLLTSLASGYWGIRDSQNGYTAISREALGWLDLDAMYDGYGFLNDMLMMLNQHGARVVDVPMPAVYGDEQSGIRYATFVPSLSLLLLRGFVRRLWRRRSVEPLDPLVVSYAIGIVGIGLSGLAVVYRFSAWLRSATSRLGPPSALALALGIALDRHEGRQRTDRDEPPEAE